nr:hypothetical protein CFP56_41266 [Quercus suber]
MEKEEAWSDRSYADYELVFFGHLSCMRDGTKEMIVLGFKRSRMIGGEQGYVRCERDMSSEEKRDRSSFTPRPRFFDLSHSGNAGARGASEGTRTGEFTDQTFSRAHVADDATAGDALDHVVGIPRDEVAVIDDVSLALGQLETFRWG